MTLNLDDLDLNDRPDNRRPVAASPAPRRNMFRVILMALIALILLCVVCFLIFRIFGSSLPAIPIVNPPTAAPPPAETTPPPEGTAEPVPATQEPTIEPGVTEEPPVGAELPATEEPPPTQEPPAGGELPATTEPTEEPIMAPTDEDLVDEHAEAPLEEEVTPPATTEPVPGPTSTPTFGPTVTVTNCEPNTAPVAEANGPYTATLGKGRAFVTFEATGSNDPDGSIVSYEWDFGDDNTGTGQRVEHGYTSTGSYPVRLTVTDNCDATSQDTVEVIISGPTPPSSEEGNSEDGG